MKKNKKTYGVPALTKLSLIVLMLLLMALTACGNKAKTADSLSDWQTQYDLGVRYLSQLDYEKAIAAFTAAIGIDPKQTDAYLKLADVYLAMGEPQKAADILAQGLEAASKTDRITEKLKEIKKQYPDMKIPSLDDGNSASDAGSNTGSDTSSDTDSDTVSDTGSDPFSAPVITAMKESIAAQFDFAAPFYEGVARVGRQTEDGGMKYFFINEDGKIISNEYDAALDFFGGVAIVGNSLSSEDSYGGNSLLYGYIDTTGKEIIPLTWRGDGEGVRPYYFYDGLAEVAWFGENGYDIYTNLIDMTGAKQFPVDIICEDNRGYGGADIDPRLLPLTQSRDYASDSWPLYTEWNPVQMMRLNGTDSWPITICDGENTLQLDANWKVVSSEPGYKENLGMYYGLDGFYILYSSFYDRELGTLVDATGNVLVENVRYAEAGVGDGIIVSCPDNTPGSYNFVYALYSRNGKRLSEDFPGLKKWVSGYIIQKYKSQNWKENSTYAVTDANLNELFTVQAKNLYQVNESYGMEGAGNPLFYRDYYKDDTSNPVEYLDVAGQVVFPYEPDTRLSLLTSEYVVRQRSDGLEIYTVDGRSAAVMPGMLDLHQIWTQEEDLRLFGYRTIEGVKNGIYDSTYAQMNVENGTLSFTEVSYNPNTGTIGETSNPSGETILAKNDYCALWGIDDYSTPPVTLKIGSKEVARNTALSLIGNNLYKQGASIEEDPEYNSYFRVTDISLHTVDGSWQSEVYEDMGCLSYNHISFCKNGKWGYLKVAP